VLRQTNNNKWCQNPEQNVLAVQQEMDSNVHIKEVEIFQVNLAALQCQMATVTSGQAVVYISNVVTAVLELHVEV